MGAKYPSTQARDGDSSSRIAVVHGSPSKIAARAHRPQYCQLHGNFLPDRAYNGPLWQLAVYTASWDNLKLSSAMNERSDKHTECVPALGNVLQQRSHFTKARLWLTIGSAVFLIALSFSQAMAATKTSAPTMTVKVATTGQVIPRT